MMIKDRVEPRGTPDIVLSFLVFDILEFLTRRDEQASSLLLTSPSAENSCGSHSYNHSHHNKAHF